MVGDRTVTAEEALWGGRGTRLRRLPRAPSGGRCPAFGYTPPPPGSTAFWRIAPRVETLLGGGRQGDALRRCQCAERQVSVQLADRNLHRAPLGNWHPDGLAGEKILARRGPRSLAPRRDTQVNDEILRRRPDGHPFDPPSYVNTSRRPNPRRYRAPSPLPEPSFETLKQQPIGPYGPKRRPASGGPSF